MSVRRLRRHTEDEEEETPRRKTFKAPTSVRASRDDDEEPEEDVDEEEDEEEERPRRKASSGTSAIRSGWSGYNRVKEEAPTRFTKVLKIPSDGKEIVVKFLEDAPYVNFLQHWCNWLGRGQQQTYICCKDTDNGVTCPLDDVNPPAMRVRFNVLLLHEDGAPTLEVFECGITVAEILVRYGNDEKTGPISKGYYALSMQGSEKNKRTALRPIKARDLGEDFGLETVTSEQIRQYRKRLQTADSVKPDDRATLRRLAKEASED